MALVLSRRIDEQLLISGLGGEVRLTVKAIEGNRVRLVCEAPRTVLVLRAEVAKGAGVSASTTTEEKTDGKDDAHSTEVRFDSVPDHRLRTGFRKRRGRSRMPRRAGAHGGAAAQPPGSPPGTASESPGDSGHWHAALAAKE